MDGVLPFYLGSPPPTTQAELERPAGTVLDIKPQMPRAKPEEFAKTLFENTGKTSIARNELALLARLQTIHTAQAAYDAMFNLGFAPSLAALNQADLIDSQLASDREDEYIFYYKPVSRAGKIKAYWLWTRPSAYNRSAIASCITSE